MAEVTTPRTAIEWGFISPETGDFIGVTEDGMREFWGAEARAAGHVEGARFGYKQGRRDALEEARAAVEILIAETGRCVLPDDYDPAELNICVTHSELIFGDIEGCEDQPRRLLAALAAIDALRERSGADT